MMVSTPAAARTPQSIPLADTVRDTLAWWAKEPRSKDEWGKKPGQPGLSDAREKEILAAWEARAR